MKAKNKCDSQSLKRPSGDQLMQKIEQLKHSNAGQDLTPPQPGSSATSNPSSNAVNILLSDEMKKAMYKAMGIQNESLAALLWGQAMMIQLYTTDGIKGIELLQKALVAIEGIQPENAIECMLAVQMIGAHSTAIKFLADSTLPNQTFDGRDANVLRATRLMRLFNEQLEALAKLRGKTGFGNHNWPISGTLFWPTLSSR
jgi:hypothetical protein